MSEPQQSHTPDPSYVPAEVEITFPGGIDYAKWEKGVTAAPRDAFADRLELLDRGPC